MPLKFPHSQCSNCGVHLDVVPFPSVSLSLTLSPHTHNEKVYVGSFYVKSGDMESVCGSENLATVAI